MNATQRDLVRHAVDARRRDLLTHGIILKRCARCGYPHDQNTPGCKTCWNRWSKRRTRALA